MKKLLVLSILLLCASATATEDPAKQLDSLVSVNFEDTALRDVLAMFASFANVDITLDAGLKDPPPITLALEEVKLKNALDLVVALIDPKLAWDVRWGGIFVGTKERLEFLPKDVPGEAEGLDKPVNVNFAETPLPDVIHFLGAFSGVDIQVDPDAKSRVAETLVTIKCNGAKLRDALSRIVFPANLALLVEDGEVRIAPAMTKRTVRESPEDRARRLLKETKVNINFEETAFSDVLQFFSQYADVGIAMDPALATQANPDELLVTLHAEDISLENALQLVTLTKKLSYDFRWGGVFVARPDRLKALPKTALPPPAGDEPAWAVRLRQALEGTISFSFDEATLSQALDFIRTLKGFNLVLSPEAKKVAETAMVTQTVNGVRTADALALMLVPYGLRFELKSEVVLISVAK